MPRYFFNVLDDALPDLQGTELAGLNIARDEALRLAGAVIKERPETFWNAKRWSMEVCDDAGLLLFALTLAATEMPSAKVVPYQRNLGGL
ncbi:DUF6894 family protein [Phenylobacterium soli]|uniref:DUF6894 domain-containing protein n=1 Tax=Phenylobacterium soli TaxID=2170551 RepID=A0A328ANT1_9CAUL|nr:hypothetical protein [Phenylobacterium soli]RAK55971.1 hypothetical protein DJ017_16365 [Phenylobacterium soli]